MLAIFLCLSNSCLQGVVKALNTFILPKACSTTIRFLPRAVLNWSWFGVKSFPRKGVTQESPSPWYALSARTFSPVSNLLINSARKRVRSWILPGTGPTKEHINPITCHGSFVLDTVELVFPRIVRGVGSVGKWRLDRTNCTIYGDVNFGETKIGHGSLFPRDLWSYGKGGRV